MCSKFSSAVSRRSASPSSMPVKWRNSKLTLKASAELQGEGRAKGRQARRVVRRQDVFSLRARRKTSTTCRTSSWKASVAVDYRSLGALLFQLVVGEPLVPSNRDDDCVNAKTYGHIGLLERRRCKRNLAISRTPRRGISHRSCSSAILNSEPSLTSSVRSRRIRSFIPRAATWRHKKATDMMHRATKEG